MKFKNDSDLSHSLQSQIRFKNPNRIPTVPMGIHHSPDTHPIPIPMGIPIPTAALHPGCAPTWRPPCVSLVAIERFFVVVEAICATKNF